MADSLVVARLFEILGGGVPSTLPPCAGAIFRLGNAYDMGTAQPVIDFTITLMGDGSRPSGHRYDNRTVTLPITIVVPSTGNSQADRLTLAGAREMLLQAVSADTFDLVWSPDGSDGTLNTVFECWRAKATTISYDIKKQRQLVSELAISFDAMPFGRSDTLAQVNFDSPVLGVNPPAGPVLLDDYTTVSSTTQPTWWQASAATPYGLGSARWRHAITNLLSPLLYTRAIPATDITGCTKLTFWLGLGADSPAAYRAWRQGLVHFTVTIGDGTRTLTMGLQQQCRASISDIWPLWNRVSVTIPVSATFNYANVVSYSIRAWSEVWTRSSGKYQVLEHAGFLAGLLATPTASPRRAASDRGGDYVLYGIEGTAPTPLNLHLQLGFQTFTTSTQTLVLPGTPGAAQTFTAPGENPNWLSGDTADAEGGTAGQWTGSDGAAANATPTASATQAHAGTQSVRVAPVSGGTNAVIASCTAANITALGVPCVPGDRIALRTWARAGTTSRNITVAAEFYNAGGTTLGAVSLTPVADTSGAWTQINGRVTAPASAAWCRMLITIATPAAGEFHYLDDAYLSWAVQATVACTGAGGAGGSTGKHIVAGGGGGGGEIAWETSLDLTPGGGHAYTIGKGGTPALSGGTGGPGGSTTFAGTSVTVNGHGGSGGTNELTTDYLNGSGGAGGTGYAGGHHFNGGAGGSGTRPSKTVGGGGGGAAGDGGAGANGSSSAAGTGGAAGSLADPGGPGSPGGIYTTPGRGLAPGGGGGGVSSYGSASHLGGTGGDGQVKMIITTYTAAAAFPAVLVHKLSGRAHLQARCVIPVGGGQDPPDGRQYQIDDVDGLPARYDGTYSVLAVASSWNGAAARTVTVTIRQYEAAGGAVSVTTTAQQVTPGNVLNGMVPLGEVTLPVKDMPADNTDSYFTIAVTSANGADRFFDILLVDTRGQVAWINLPGGGYTDYYFDAPDLRRGTGLVLGTMDDRTQAVSVLASTWLSGGPMRLTPGDNVFTVYSPAGMPALEGDYWPRWWNERLS